MSARILVALGGAAAPRVASELSRAGLEIVGVVDPGAPSAAASDLLTALDLDLARDALARATALVLRADRRTLTADLVAACDRRGVRILPVCDDADAQRWAAAFGLEPALVAAEAWAVIDALRADPAPGARAGSGSRGRLIAVWGPGGAPGRSTIASLVAFELARGGRHSSLIDADVHAPSLALSLGIADEGPGFAAACRQAGLGSLDARELTRISVPLAHAGGIVDVLCGLNRTGRWPELAEDRVSAALEACRGWADAVVVDVSSSLERDEELMSDLDGPRRNGATSAALASADLVIAVCAADPVGVARFLRGYAELRATIGSTRVVVAVNKLRPGALGFDARGQIRRTLERFAGIDDVFFLPLDPRSTDAAVLQARPIADVSPRSPLVAAARRLVGEAVQPAVGGELASAGPRSTRRARRRMGTDRLSA
jgi:MinD-like ATPase involved in chromosome partitioning or flagellar assembly